MRNSHVLPNSNTKTKSLTFHLYSKHYKEFVEICERIERFHSEVLRGLVMDFIKKNKGQSPRDESEQTQVPFVQY